MKYISFRKAFRDMGQAKGRTATVAVAVFLGVFAVAMMTSAYLLLNKNLHTNYVRTNPASIILVTDRADSAVLDRLTQLPEIADAEVRDSVLARFQIGPDTYVPLLLTAVSNFRDVRVNKFSLEKGAFPQAPQDMVIERTAGKLTAVEKDRTYGVTIPGAGVYKVRVSGIVHDPGFAPSWMEGVLYGYVKQGFAGPANPDAGHTILLTVRNNKYDARHIEAVKTGVLESLNGQGVKVLRTEVPKPGKHVHQAQMDSLMFLLVMFGVLTLFLSFSLIINMISAIMAREVRQIGVMKAIGASSGRITLIYLTFVLIIALGATVVATPAGILVGTAYAKFVASMLNFTLFDRTVGLLVVSAILLIGILLPCLAALFPIYRNSLVTVREALDDYGVGTKERATKGKPPSGRAAGRFLRSRAFLFSLRNTFRRKTRFVLTLITLVLGGAIFMTTFNIRASMTGTLGDRFDNQKYDLAVVLAHPYTCDKMGGVLSPVEGVDGFECWDSVKMTRVQDHDVESSQVDLRAVPVPSKVFSTEVIAGSWLVPGDEGVVINHALAVEQPDLTVGKRARFKINGRIDNLTVKGIIREVFTAPAAYMDYGVFAARHGFQGKGRLVMIDVGDRWTQRIQEVTRQIEKTVASQGIAIKMVYNKLDYKARMVDHLLVITSMLIVMTLLVVVVGGLGIVATMGINVVERRRELGILRAIGATDGLLYRIVGYEGFVVGLLSWVCAALLSFPLSYWLGNVFFQIFFHTTINFRIDPWGIVAGFFVNLVFGTLAVLIPTGQVVRTPVSEALAYE